MNRITSSEPSRRLFLTSAVAFFFVGTTLARARTLAGGLPWEAGTATPPVVVRSGPWVFFTADEAAMIEAIVDRLIPSDTSGPGGKDAGCAVFIDRQLAGPYGRSEGLYTRRPFMPSAATQGYQLPDSPAARYRTGLRALADYIKSNFAGKSFHDLAPNDQDTVLKGLESGSIVLKDVKSAEFFSLLLANTQEGFFADPI
jgi:gluconate 2-dehydrogenase gamma chain